MSSGLIASLLVNAPPTHFADRWARAAAVVIGSWQPEVQRACLAQRNSAMGDPAHTRRALCIGLGGGSLAMFLAHHWPGLEVDAVELDPLVLEAATKGMGCTPGRYCAKQYMGCGKGSMHVWTHIICYGFTIGATLTIIMAVHYSSTTSGPSQSHCRDVFLRHKHLQNSLSLCGRPGLQLHVGEAGAYMRQLAAKIRAGQEVPFSLVFVDAFDGEDLVPAHLTCAGGRPVSTGCSEYMHMWFRDLDYRRRAPYLPTHTPVPPAGC